MLRRFFFVFMSCDLGYVAGEWGIWEGTGALGGVLGGEGNTLQLLVPTRGRNCLG